MSFPRYSDYRDTGVEWIGEVPSHWLVEPLRGLVVERKEKNLGMISNNLLSLSYGRIVPKDINTTDGLLPESFETYQIVRAGDIVFRLTDLQNDKRSLRSALVEEDGIITSAYLCVRPTKGHPRFLSYLFRAYDSAKVFYSMGGGLRQSMKFSDFKLMPVVLPPVEEQTAIACFLDTEIFKIDALIADQQRLVGLLKEKRQAVISHAVTEGLNSDASMKSSGIDWINEIPAHWEIRVLASLITKITNGYVGPTRDVLVDEGVRYLQSLHIKDNTIRFDTPYYVTKEWSEQHQKSILRKGDVLVVQTGDIGQVAVVPDEFEGCNCHALIILTPKHNEIRGDWLSWVLNSNFGFHSLMSIKTGALHPHLNCGNVKYLRIPVPPIEEQGEIVTYLEEQLDQFDRLIGAALYSVELLKERRSALISAAVTGKIDVRGDVLEEAM